MKYKETPKSSRAARLTHVEADTSGAHRWCSSAHGAPRAGVIYFLYKNKISSSDSFAAEIANHIKQAYAAKSKTGAHNICTVITHTFAIFSLLFEHYYEELTLKEVASVLEVSESRVSQLHSKALEKMKKHLGKYFELLMG